LEARNGLFFVKEVNPPRWNFNFNDYLNVLLSWLRMNV